MHTCAICGTTDPHGGVQACYSNGERTGHYICAYRFGCWPGVTRPNNG